MDQVALSCRLYVLTLRPWLRNVLTGLVKTRPPTRNFGYSLLSRNAVSERRKPPRSSLVSVGDAVQRQLRDSRWSLMVLLTGGNGGIERALVGTVGGIVDVVVRAGEAVLRVQVVVALVDELVAELVGARVEAVAGGVQAVAGAGGVRLRAVAAIIALMVGSA